MDNWLNETLYPDWGQRFRVLRELARVRSEYQDIQVIETASHGRVLVLDGAIQITEADEFVYQEMLAHVPLLAYGAARRVLIIGAGDGGVLRRVLQHRTVEQAVMVEIDGEVIRLCREHLPGIGGDAWTDRRAQVIVGDGIAHVADAAPGSYDVIIVDSTDPVGVGEALFTDAFYADCARVLSPAGLVVNQSGVPFMQPDELRETSRRRARAFPACVGLRRRGADLCRRADDARHRREERRDWTGCQPRSSATVRRQPASWARPGTGRRTSTPGPLICRPTLRSCCPKPLCGKPPTTKQFRLLVCEQSPCIFRSSHFASGPGCRLP